ncbi:MAG: TetR/AcrR family transcriptional regulator [Oscillospiraceae bacterium]|nr:TetR/AcrR family transcriptional regulator [Oscillospiraceae bacterium]MDY6207298.1 TetR/AcrR family transcriptional regulator [Oscillospiraceae bacterium]
MTKRKGAVSEETKEAILTAAAEEFYECGYEKASLRHICSRAGVTTGAVYCFFDNKEDLLSNVMTPIFNVVRSISIDYYKVLNDDYTAFDEFQKFFSANRKLYNILYYNMNTPVIEGYIKAITEEFTHQIMDMAHKALPASKEFDDYISRCLAHIMVYSIIKIISEESDDRIVTQRLITTVRVYKNGILSLIK